jgi:hypothetical protein
MRRFTRVTVAPADHAFLDTLTVALGDAGYKVEAINDPSLKASRLQASDKLEITISRSTGAYPGVRIRATGFPAGQPFAGPLGQFLAEPLQVSAVLNAMSSPGLDRRTLARWRAWWRSTFSDGPFAAVARAAVATPLDIAGLPASLLDRFAGDVREQLTALLRFLAPLSGGASAMRAS